MKKVLIIKLLMLLFIPNYIFASNDTDRNIVEYGRNFSVAENEKYNNIKIFGGDLKVEGQVNNIVVLGGNLTITKTADILGKVSVFGGNLNLEDGAKQPENFNKTTMQSEITNILFSPEAIASSLETKNLFKFNLNITNHILFFLLGLACLWFFEKTIKNISLAIQTRPFAIPGYGLLAWLCFTPILILLIMSIIGIILIPFLLIFYFLASIFGWTAISLLVGKLSVSKWKPDLSIYVTLLCGSFIVAIICSIPFISLIISIIGAFYALGAVMITKFGQRHLYG